MSSTTRTFIAVKALDPVTKALTKLRGRLDPSLPGLRWVEPEQLHLTLAFLGDVDHADLVPICQAVAGAIQGRRRFELHVQGLGVFPTADRPRVLWAGLVGNDLEKLNDMQKAIGSAVRDVGYPPSDDRFHPHITLGRFNTGRGFRSGGRGSFPLPVSSADLNAILNRYRDWVGGTFPIAEVVTFASMLTQEGPVYSSMAKTALGSAKRKGST